MKKVPKKSIAITLTSFLVIGSILCCCLGIMPFTQVSNAEASHSDSHCHSHDAADSASSSETEDCECHYSNAVLADLNLDLIKPETIFAKLSKEKFHLYTASNNIKSDYLSQFQHSSPRLYRRGVSLYLENSILRI